MEFAHGREALANFYDEHAGNVRQYCAMICPAPFVDEATFVAFRDFLARLAQAGPEPDVEDLLWKATRGAAAGRAEVRAHVDSSSGGFPQTQTRTEPGATCLAMPELLAAYVSRELPRNGELDEHLLECAVCRSTAMRFRDAETAFTTEPRERPPDEIRRAWLEIATSARAATSR
ncbi:MAG TPA: hypothetical protein VG186_18630 [Solirubrobacteraceae bacterium]|nr:hypothetical protein [Solirubrobacteraceae bacterium]